MPLFLQFKKSQHKLWSYDVRHKISSLSLLKATDKETEINGKIKMHEKSKLGAIKLWLNLSQLQR